MCTSSLVPLFASLLLLTGCPDNGTATTDEECSPIVKFSHPSGVTPRAEDGLVTYSVRTECTGSLELWAWTEASSEAGLALEVLPKSGEPGAYAVLIPVEEEAAPDYCRSAAIVVALVDGYGDLVDMDRAHLPYELAGP